MGRHYAIVPFFIPHQGCPFNCIFCDQRRITGLQQAPSAQEIGERIQEAIAGLPPTACPEVAFYGGSFTGLEPALQEKLLEPAFAAYRKGLIKGIRISTRPDLIDEGILTFLAERGVKTVELGVQSLDAEVLAASGRNYTASQVEEAAALIKQRGFSLGMQIMLGLPRDTWEKAVATAKKIASWGPDFVRLYPAVVIRNTPLADLYLARKYQPLSLEEAIVWAAELYLFFEWCNIKVIRMGLHPSETLLKPGEVVGGPFHPAFGELVSSRIARWQIETLLDRCGLMGEGYRRERTREVALLVNPRFRSPVAGHKKDNLVYFLAEWGIDIKIKGDRAIGYRDCVARWEEEQKILEFSFTWKEFLSSRRIK